MASQTCSFGPHPVNADDVGQYREVVGWVTGPKRDGMTLRQDTGRVACRVCIHKMQQGQPADQPTLFEAAGIPEPGGNALGRDESASGPQW